MMMYFLYFRLSHTLSRTVCLKNIWQDDDRDICVQTEVLVSDGVFFSRRARALDHHYKDGHRDTVQ